MSKVEIFFIVIFWSRIISLILHSAGMKVELEFDAPAKNRVFNVVWDLVILGIISWIIGWLG